MSKAKKKIYLNEYNIPTNNSIYLPYSSGLLQAYAQTTNAIYENYEFVKIFFQRDTIENIIDRHEDPDVVGFSVSMWNYELSLAVAKALKEKFPNCCIVFGGPHITQDEGFFDQYPFVDFCIYREGERIFRDILMDRGGLIDPILNCYSLARKTVLVDSQSQKDLDWFPSPYTNGIFCNIIKEHPELEFKAIIETNRNCPFNCAFCYWGSNDISNKIRYHSLDYLKEEFEWIARNKIKYVFCADANFGMYKRDTDIAKMCSAIKDKHGYPEKFRVCYGKKATDNIFNAAQELSKSDLAKTVTLSVQSFNQKVLDSINRKNIKLETFEKLRQKYNEANMPTYTELILGLPNETHESFMSGLEKAIRLTKDNQIFIYHCQVLPNTLLANKEYQERHGIKTIKIPLTEVHVTARQNDFVQEFDEIIVQTNTMSVHDWTECTVISWVVQLFHSLGIGREIVNLLVRNYDINYMDFYIFLTQSTHIKEVQNLWDVAYGIPYGKPRCRLDEKFGNTHYEMEELTYLKIVCDKERFYDELYNNIKYFLEFRGIDIDTLVVSIDLEKVITKQRDKLPNYHDFESLEDFATQTIIYGRKNNKVTPETAS